MQVTKEQRDAWQRNTSNSPFNRWLDSHVRGPSGQLDLTRLHSLAREFGVDTEAEYAHLNPGQQRMNIGNRLRRLVPTSLYQANASAVEKSSTTKRVEEAAALLASRFPFVKDASSVDLLRVHGAILDELRMRGVVRTSNGPVGDYAEGLFARAFGWKLANNSASGHDALDADGVRYQIKGRRLTRFNASRQLSAIRKLPEGTFDFLAAVIFDASYEVSKALILPHAVVLERAKFRSHTNGWTFMLDDSVWDLPGARDCTAELTAAARETQG